MKIKYLLALGLILTFSGCTHTPIESGPNTAYYDPSTPSQYTAFNSGYLDIIEVGNKTLVVLTSNRAKSEPTAVPYTDKYGNKVFTVDASVIIDESDVKQTAIAAKLKSAK